MTRQNKFDPFIDAITEAFKTYVKEEIQKLREEQDQQLREVIQGLVGEFNTKL